MDDQYFKHDISIGFQLNVITFSRLLKDNCLGYKPQQFAIYEMFFLLCSFLETHFKIKK